MTICEDCDNYVYDETDDCYYCDVNLDEDEMARYLSSGNYNCPFYRHDDEYSIVRKQN